MFYQITEGMTLVILFATVARRANLTNLTYLGKRFLLSPRKYVLMTITDKKADNVIIIIFKQ